MNDTVKLQVEVVNLKPEDLNVHVIDASGNRVKVLNTVHMVTEVKV